MGYEEKQQLAKPLHFDGLDTYSTSISIDEYSSPSLNNVDLHPFGSISKRKGFTDYIPTDPESLWEAARADGLLHLNRPSAAVSYLYAIRDGVFNRRVHGGEWEELLLDGDPAGTPAGTPLSIYNSAVARYNDGVTEMGESLYIANGTERPFIDWGEDTEIRQLPVGVYGSGPEEGIPGVPGTGSSGEFPDLEFRDWDANPPSGFHLIGRGTTERMLAWGFADDPSRIDYSELSVPWNFLRKDLVTAKQDPAVDGGYFRAMRSDGDRVVAVVDLLGYLVVFKERRIMIYSGEPGSDLALTNIYPVGCISASSIIDIGNDLAFWSEDGVHSLSAVRRHGDLAQSRIDKDIRGLTPSLVKRSMHKICGYHDADNARVIWFVPEEGSLENNAAYVFYYDVKPRWTRYDGEFCATTACLNANIFEASSSVAFTAGIEGSVRQLLDTDTDGGENISAFYTSKWLDVSASEIRKRILWVDIFASDSDSDVLDIAFAWDFVEEWFNVSDSLGSLGENVPGAWDSAVWDESDWDTGTATIKRYLLEGTGYLLRVRISDDGPTGFRVDGWKPEIRMKGLQ